MLRVLNSRPLRSARMPLLLMSSQSTGWPAFTCCAMACTTSGARAAEYKACSTVPR